MNHLLDHDLDRDSADLSHDREISLGPGTILGIFFALALLCACFFGFGYSVGRRSAQSASVQPVVTSTTPTSGAAKPAAGSSVPPAPVTTAPVQAPNLPADAMIVGDRPTLTPSPTAQPAPAPPAAAINPAGSFMVQVAAVSSQEIADIEVSALKKDGYSVVIRHEPTDKLLHVQIGPFADRKEAEAMRQKVIADGFNAIVK
jgi:cell division septation protein DedD